METLEATTKKSLREVMRISSGFVDSMRAAFGADEVNGWLLGRNGGAFWASENGHEWGERPELGTQSMSAAAYQRLGEPRRKAATVTRRRGVAERGEHQEQSESDGN